MTGLTPGKGSLAVLKSPGSKVQSLCGSEKFLCETVASAVHAKAKAPGKFLRRPYSGRAAVLGRPLRRRGRRRHIFYVLRVSRRFMGNCSAKSAGGSGRRPRLPPGDSCLTSGEAFQNLGESPRLRDNEGIQGFEKSPRGEGPARTARPRVRAIFSNTPEAL